MKHFLIICAILTAYNVNGQYARNVSEELDRIDAKIGLVVPFGIDYFPIWSEDSKKIYFNIRDTWKIFDLNKVVLVETVWRDWAIGYNPKAIFELADSTLIGSFELDRSIESLLISTNENTEAKIEQYGLQSGITIKHKGEVVFEMVSGGEVYHSPAISPDGKYVAFIAEMNGLMLVKLDKKPLSNLSKFEKARDKGIAAMNNNDREIALEAFNKALEIDEKSSLVLFNLGLLYQQKGEYKLSIDYLQRCIETDSLNYQPYYELAYSFANKGESEKALSTLQKGEKLTENRLGIYYLMGAVYKNMGDIDNACLYYSKSYALGERGLKETIDELCK